MAEPAAKANTDIIASFVLLAATAAALIVANSPVSAVYEGTLKSILSVNVADFTLQYSVKDWIKNALMAIFFLYVGLEIKAEFMEGSLSDRKRATLPFLAAAGGMAVPAIVYLIIVGFDPQYTYGWAIPAATDIAFAVGVVGLLGKRVSPSLKAFLLAVAVIDDMGAILIIALFYSGPLEMLPLLYAGACLLVLLVFNLTGVMSVLPYLLVGFLLWLSVGESGINPTLAGVATALFVPLHGRNAEPLHDLVVSLRNMVLFVIMPLFAFANAGVPLAGMSPAIVIEPVTLGVIGGLFIGKPIGITIFALLAIRSGLARAPDGAGPMHIFGIGCIAGIGFTMSLFIGGLAFSSDLLMNEVRLGVLIGSTLAALLGVLVLTTVERRSAALRAA
jgi:NhaA family Na+:H+ antiporter